MSKSDKKKVSEFSEWANDVRVLKGCMVYGPNVPMEERAEYRHQKITGTRIPIIMGVNKYGGSKFRLATEMCGPVPPPLPKDNYVVRAGSHMESLVKGILMEIRDDFKPWGEYGTIEHPTEKDFAASPDWIIEDKYGPAVVEIKTQGRYTSKEWKDGKHAAYHEAQLQWYMGILNDCFADAAGVTPDKPKFDHGYLVGFLENRSIEVRFILFDKEWYEDAKAKALEFMAAVKSQNPEKFMFDEVHNDDALAVVGESDVDSAPMPDSANEHAYAILRLKREIDEKQSELNEHRYKLGTKISGAAKSSNDKFMVSWPRIAGRKKFDMDAFRAAHPEIDLDPYYKTGKDYRGGLRVTNLED